MRRPSRSRLIAATAASLTVAAVAFTATSAPAATEPPVTFGVPRIVDPIHAYGEPNMIVNPNGTVHASGPQGTGVQRSIWNISVDGGDSYRLAQATACPPQYDALQVCGKGHSEPYDTSALAHAVVLQKALGELGRAVGAGSRGRDPGA